MQRSNVRWSALLASAFALSLLLYACGLPTPTHNMSHMRGDDGRDEPPVTALEEELTVEIRDYAFRPGNLTVRVGTRVTWTNLDSAAHTATDDRSAWDTGMLAEGESQTISFDEPGIYDYRCLPHPNMRARIEVTA